MALAFTILITFLLGITVILIYGKANIKRIIVPLLIILIGDFLLLYAKFVVGYNFLTFIYVNKDLYLPAMILFIISLIWLIIIFIISIAGNNSKKKMIAIVFCLSMSTVIIFVPSLKQDDKFKLYQKDFYSVSDAIFQAYDEGDVSVEEQFASPPFSTYDLDELKAVFSDKIINKMEKLNRSAGIYTYIVADEDVIYFSFGAVFQSISGIAISRNGKDPSSDEILKMRFFDGNTSYRYIREDAYHFSDGL